MNEEMVRLVEVLVLYAKKVEEVVMEVVIVELPNELLRAISTNS